MLLNFVDLIYIKFNEMILGFFVGLCNWLQVAVVNWSKLYVILSYFVLGVESTVHYFRRGS